MQGSQDGIKCVGKEKKRNLFEKWSSTENNGSTEIKFVQGNVLAILHAYFGQTEIGCREIYRLKQ